MYPLDINLTTALDRQADRVRAVNARGSLASARLSMPGAIRPNASWLNTPARAAMAFAVVAPAMLLTVWSLLAR